ncbi:microfibrillar-associated protein 5 isoform X4 [Cebus imitator]|uniref:Microfibril associated protein 5 n=1 Tax=Cebus imitator TaxID=2715852 RepID=A0A2K5QZ53_CEBIM|nr:microfibrillar-associated protein 5 isoform X4 [Cebus imitator]
MLLLGPKVLLFLAAFIIPSDWILLGVNSQRGDDVTPVTPETFTEDPNLVNDPATDETDCWVETFACTRLYSVRRPVRLCIHQSCFIRFRRTYHVNKEICTRLVCKEHEAMKDELCRQMVGLPPRRLRRHSNSNYVLVNLCENVDLQKLSGL